MKRAAAYKQLFDSELGKEVLKHLSEEAGCFRTSFVSEDPHATSFNEGKRHMLNHIFGITNQNPELLRQAMQREVEQGQLRDILSQEHGIND